MKSRYAVFVLLLLFLPAISNCEDHRLTFVKQIGVGRQPDKWAWMSFVSFSPDGTMVASDGPAAPDDVSESLTLWSFPEGRLIRQLHVLPTSISPDWKYYASAHGLWDMETGKVLLSLKGDAYAEFAFSPDGRYVAESSSAQGRHDSQIRVLELATGRQVSGFGRTSPFSLAISPDGKTLASGYWDVVALWDMVTGKRLAVLHGFGRYVKSLSFSKDGGLLAAGTDLGGLQIWDVHRQTRLHSLDMEGQYVAPAFSPDGRLVAAGIYGTGSVWLIDVETGKIIDRQKVSDIGCGAVAFSPDGQYLITPSTGGLVTWPYDRAGTIRVFKVNAP